jgi:cyclopropane-fatty-acyl-phospholipid synthase
LTQITDHSTGHGTRHQACRDASQDADSVGYCADGRDRARIDAARWPDIASIPAGKARAAVARALFDRVTARPQVRVVTADGTSRGGSDDSAPRLPLHRGAEFYQRLGAAELIGFGESYMAGDWDSDDLPGLLTVFAAQVATLVPPRMQWLRRWYVPPTPPAEDGTPDGARRNIHRHYDPMSCSHCSLTTP